MTRPTRIQCVTMSCWALAWAELHHQGDVGEASYALVPYLLDFQSRQRELDEQLFHFCVIIDLAQPENNNYPTLHLRPFGRVPPENPAIALVAYDHADSRAHPT